MLAAQFNVLDSVYTGLSCDSNKEKFTLTSLLKFIDSFLDPANITELEKTVNRYMDSLMERFYNDFPKLPVSQKQLFLFYAIGLTPQMISVMFKTKVEALYTRKAKLKKKIMESSSPSKSEYLQFLT